MTNVKTKTASQLGREFGAMDGKIETMLASLKSSLLACNADKKLEDKFAKDWKASYMKAKGANDTSARKAWSRYRGAALAGKKTTQSEADIRAKATAKKASGTKTQGAKGGAVPAAISQANTGSKADNQPSGKVGNAEIFSGAVTELRTMRTRASKGEIVTPKQLAAFCDSLIIRLEIASGLQLDN
jgi:hypothetical protein